MHAPQAYAVHHRPCAPLATTRAISKVCSPCSRQVNPHPHFIHEGAHASKHANALCRTHTRERARIGTQANSRDHAHADAHARVRTRTHATTHAHASSTRRSASRCINALWSIMISSFCAESSVIVFAVFCRFNAESARVRPYSEGTRARPLAGVSCGFCASASGEALGPSCTTSLFSEMVASLLPTKAFRFRRGPPFAAAPGRGAGLCMSTHSMRV